MSVALLLLLLCGLCGLCGLSGPAALAADQTAANSRLREALRTVVTPSSRWSADSPCTDSERWSIDSSLEPSVRTDLASFLAGSTPPVRAFSDAVAFRRLAQLKQDPRSRLLAEFWISRALYQAGMGHVAFTGFNAVAGAVAPEDAAGVQLAAVACMVRIIDRYPSLGPSPATVQRVSRLLEQASASSREARLQTSREARLQTSREARLQTSREARLQSKEEREGAFALLSRVALGALAQGKPPDAELELLRGSGPYEELVTGLLALSRDQLKPAERLLAAFARREEVPETLRPARDSARLALARARFALGRYADAALDLRAIRKGSNEIARALSDLAWVHLLEGHYGQAIGAAINLSSGGLRLTYAPEAPMVMAMALNELCQFPESIQAIRKFRKDYEPVYSWLDAWLRQGASDRIYPLAVAYLRKQPTAPHKLASEWVRSPQFIALQDELNLFFDEREHAERMGRSGSIEQQRLAEKIRRHFARAKADIRAWREKHKPGAPLARALIEDLESLRDELTRFKRLRAAAPTWRTILESHRAGAPKRERTLVSLLETDLALRSRRMHTQLQEIAENNQLIEIEIYNGASQDIIWQNAHPEYKDQAKKWSDDGRPGADAGKVWDWGRSPAGSEEGGEVWEDELGSSSADLYDNCASKDRYLALKRVATN